MATYNISDKCTHIFDFMGGSEIENDYLENEHVMHEQISIQI